MVCISSDRSHLHRRSNVPPISLIVLRTFQVAYSPKTLPQTPSPKVQQQHRLQPSTIAETPAQTINTSKPIIPIMPIPVQNRYPQPFTLGETGADPKTTNNKSGVCPGKGGAITAHRSNHAHPSSPHPIRAIRGSDTHPSSKPRRGTASPQPTHQPRTVTENAPSSAESPTT